MVLPRRRKESGILSGYVYKNEKSSNSTSVTIEFGNAVSGAKYLVSVQTITAGPGSSGISISYSNPSNYNSNSKCTVTGYGNGVFKVVTTGIHATLTFSLASSRSRLKAVWWGI